MILFGRLSVARFQNSYADSQGKALHEQMNLPPSTSPSVSIVIPVFNDPGGAKTTLRSLIEQDYDSYEIVPIDNGSTDETGNVLTQFRSECPHLVRPNEETDIQSSYAARNTGIKTARGDILLFLDANMWVPETWVGQMIEALELEDCDYLGCNVEIATDDDPNLPERYESALSFPVEAYLEDEHFVPTCALAVRREVFTEVGTFDERLVSGGDREFGHRVYDAGFRQCYAEDVTAYHPARDSFEALFSKAKRIGRGRAQTRRFHSDEINYPNPLHPINFLPPSPWRLRRRYSGGSVSTSDTLAYYLLEYALKLTQSVSALSEALNGREADDS